jgi:hypothetical protein
MSGGVDSVYDHKIVWAEWLYVLQWNVIMYDT